MAVFSAGPNHRDAVVEDEILHCGYFADVAFKFRSAGSCGSYEVEEVYGQSALFSMLSPPLRQLLQDPAEQHTAGAMSSTGRLREVRLDGLVTVHGFREVARYVYRLPQRFTRGTLPDALCAAHKLQLPELEEAALSWGLAELAAVRHERDVVPYNSSSAEAAAPSSADGPSRDCDERLVDALRCLDQLCALESGTPSAGSARRWREALLTAFAADELLASPAFLQLSADAFRELLEGQAIHADPCSLWCVAVSWARGCAEHETSAWLTPSGSNQPPGSIQAPPSSSGPPMSSSCRGARLAVPPAPPKAEGVEWQRCLMPLAAQMHFWRMAPPDFAKHIEALDPMLVDLRQVIYATRRRGLREAAGQPSLRGDAGVLEVSQRLAQDPTIGQQASAAWHAESAVREAIEAVLCH